MERIGKLYHRKYQNINYDIFKDSDGTELVEISKACLVPLNYFNMNEFERFEEIKK